MIRSGWSWIVLGFVMSRQCIEAGEKKVTPLSHEVFARGYFVKNNAPLTSNPTYQLLKDRPQFERWFGIGFVMGPRPKMVDDKLFDTKVIATVIKSGTTLWNYEVEQVYVDKQRLMVKYKASGKETPSTKYNSPLILAVPRGDYSEVILIENGKEVAKLPMSQ